MECCLMSFVIEQGWKSHHGGFAQGGVKIKAELLPAKW